MVVVPVVVVAAIFDDAGAQGLGDANEEQNSQDLRDMFAHFILRPQWTMSSIKPLGWGGDPAALGQNYGLL